MKMSPLKSLRNVRDLEESILTFYDTSEKRKQVVKQNGSCSTCIYLRQPTGKSKLHTCNAPLRTPRNKTKYLESLNRYCHLYISQGES